MCLVVSSAQRLDVCALFYLAVSLRLQSWLLGFVVLALGRKVSLINGQVVIWLSQVEWVLFSNRINPEYYIVYDFLSNVKFEIAYLIKNCVCLYFG